MLTIADLLKTDRGLKGDSDDEWKMLRAFFEDRSRDITIEQLQALEMGIAKNKMPIEVPAIRRMIRRLATVYKAPANRWLKKGKKRLAQENTAQVLYTDMLDRARMNAMMRLTDRWRTLFKQVVVRFYPSDERRGVVMRVFPPYSVKRDPSSSDPELISADNQFALRIGGEGDNEIFEHWTRDGQELADGRRAWRMRKVNKKGDVLARPFEKSDDENPYMRDVAGEVTPVLPVLMIYDEEPNGRAWIPPPMSRAAMQIALNAKLNDLMALVRGEAHSDEFIATDRPEDVPDITGIGSRIKLPKDATVQVVSKSPKIEESISTIRNAGKQWMIFEGLPSADMDDSKTILTGAALRVQEGELRELREEQIDFALADEQSIFVCMRAVWNLHAESWAQVELPDDLELEVQIADVDTPTEPASEQGYAHKEIESGYLHPIEWIQKREQVDEREAIKRWEHTRTLYEKYPVELEPAAPPAPALVPPPTEIPKPVGSPGGDREPMDPLEPAAAA